MKRTGIIGGLVLLAIVIAVLLWQVSGMASPRRLAVEKYAQVREGMTQSEVEELLGGPAGNYGRVVGHHRRAGYSQTRGEGVVGWLRRITGR